MAMLAEPRRKQKLINLRAKNNAWSNDNTKFGQRMLEKMGWTSGKGLGANENGIVEHVIAKYKNDDKGLGFEDRNDQWTKHEDDFNSLLANLSNGDGDKKEVKLHSGVSLEVKSKKSKARVHYHKYTRGKDLTRYSDKDLANIFGKKTLKEAENNPEILKPDNLKSTEVVFTEKGSMEDYFKNKMAAIKGKNKITINNNHDVDSEFAFRGFAGTYTENIEDDSDQIDNGVAFQGFSFNESNDNKIPEFRSDEPVKSKKSKKSKTHDPEAQENTALEKEAVLETNDELKEAEPTKKKSKKKKNKHLIEHEISLLEEPPKKKKKEHVEASQIVEEVDENNHVPKKKKKRKNKNHEL